VRHLLIDVLTAITPGVAPTTDPNVAMFAVRPSLLPFIVLHHSDTWPVLESPWVLHKVIYKSFCDRP